MAGRRAIGLGGLLLVMLLARPGLCTPDGDAPPETEARNSLLLSLVPLGAAFGEVRYERAFVQRVTGVLILGYGRPVVDHPTDDVGELGAQLRYFVAGNFRDGAVLALEGIWLQHMDSPLHERGLATGAKLGWKYAHPIGWTAEFLVGGAWVVAWGDQLGSGKLHTYGRLQPSINLGAGWTF
ncbi:MAG: hypothetical protein ACOYOB_13165 [Myxococcota bacterium]